MTFLVLFCTFPATTYWPTTAHRTTKIPALLWAFPVTISYTTTTSITRTTHLIMGTTSGTSQRPQDRTSLMGHCLEVITGVIMQGMILVATVWEIHFFHIIPLAA